MLHTVNGTSVTNVYLLYAGEVVGHVVQSVVVGGQELGQVSGQLSKLVGDID